MAAILEHHVIAREQSYPGVPLRIVAVTAEDAASYAHPIEDVNAQALRALYVDQLGTVSADELAEVCDPTSPTHITESEVSIRNMRPQDCILAAEVTNEDGAAEVVGTLHGSNAYMPPRLWTPGHRTVALVENVAVRPDYQHRGIGSLLVNRFLAGFDDEQYAVLRVLDVNAPMAEALLEHGMHRDRIHASRRYLGGSKSFSRVSFIAPYVKDVHRLIAPQLEKHATPNA